MADIDKDDIADQCLTMALQCGINAHYLAAVAMMRSKLKDDVVNGQFGPYLWSQADWDANPDRTNPALGVAFASNDIKDWRAQVSVFALMAAREFATLHTMLGQNPSALQLYQKQWPGAVDPPLAGNLQQACDDTKQAIVEAINQQLPDNPAADAPIITSPKNPMTAQPAPGGGGAGGLDGAAGVGLGAAATPKAIPPDDPAPFASFAPSASTTFWPVVNAAADTRLVSYEPATGPTVGRPGRCFFAARRGTRHHAGVDLFATEGDIVVACADGKIENFYKFYNSKGRDTFALMIEHPGVVINYGEVAPDSLTGSNMKVGDSVSAGHAIGRVGATGMLHFETYAPGTKQNVRWMVGQPRPWAIRNPTQLLLALAAAGKGGDSVVHVASNVTSPANDLSEALKPALRTALRLHEIGDASPYQLFFAGKGASGASFGFMQGDLAAGQPEVTQTFHDALAIAKFAESQIQAFVQRLSVHLISNPLDVVDTKSVNAALLASRELVDAMDEQILAGVYKDLTRCLQTASDAGRTIAPKAIIFMALWINMSGPPTSLLRWLSGQDPGLSQVIPRAGTMIDGPAMESYLRATAYYRENPGNLPHMLQCAAAGAMMLPSA